MTKTLKTFAKGGIATATFGAMALAGATPAMANDHRDRGLSTGDVIAGAVIIGGIAAIAETMMDFGMTAAIVATAIIAATAGRRAAIHAPLSSAASTPLARMPAAPGTALLM